jgi:hypothetical protein
VRAPRAAEPKSARASCAVREQGEIEKHYSVYFCGERHGARARAGGSYGSELVRAGFGVEIVETASENKRPCASLGKGQDISQGGHM